MKKAEIIAEIAKLAASIGAIKHILVQKEITTFEELEHLETSILTVGKLLLPDDEDLKSEVSSNL
jgi:hypothetical protein